MKTDRILLIKDETQIIGSFSDEPAAYEHLLRVQPQSTQYALNDGGYSIETRKLYLPIQVTLTRAEGPTNIAPENCAGRTETVKTISEANEVLQRWRKTAHHDKIDFTIQFSHEDWSYSGCYILAPDETPDLLGHVKNFLEFYGGIKKPSNLTQRQWDEHLKIERKAGRISDAVEFYNICDVHILRPALPQPEDESIDNEFNADGLAIGDPVYIGETNAVGFIIDGGAADEWDDTCRTDTDGVRSFSKVYPFELSDLKRNEVYVPAGFIDKLIMWLSANHHHQEITVSGQPAASHG